MHERRPLGVTILALLKFCEAGWDAVIAVLFVVSPSRLHPPQAWALWERLLFALVALFIAWLFLLWARGLWRLKNWARILEILAAVICLIPTGGSVAIFMPIDKLVPSSPVKEFLELAVAIAIVVYLFSPKVRVAFGLEATGSRPMLISACLCFASLAYFLVCSGPEFEALKWHWRHGNSVLVNGVKFPVSRWNYPSVNSQAQAFTIDDFKHGPLRPETNGVVEVSGDKGSISCSTPSQCVEQQLAEYRNSGYPKLSTFQLAIGKQSLGCVRSDSFSHAIYCYGDGPIYSVFFTGNDVALDKFNRMMAAAR